MIWFWYFKSIAQIIPKDNQVWHLLKLHWKETVSYNSDTAKFYLTYHIELNKEIKVFAAQQTTEYLSVYSCNS